MGNSRKIRRFRRFARLASSTLAGRKSSLPLHLSTPSRVSALCPSSVKDRAPHLSVVAPLKCQYRRALIPR
ncbi:hypothetical protein FYV86_24000, partial [Salmonella enterica subsp. enterica]|nr:hypothetical protein [Salmonella enterica subsp. enterica]